MGVDFLRSKAKSFEKAFDRGRAEITRKTLFTSEPGGITQHLVARSVDHCPLKVGDPVLMRSEGEQMLVMVDVTVYGRVVKPPEGMLNAVRSAGGYAKGCIAASYPSLSLLEVSLQ